MYMLMEVGGLVPVEEYSGAHLGGQHRLEDIVHLIEQPGVVDNVDRVRGCGVARLKHSLIVRALCLALYWWF